MVFSKPIFFTSDIPSGFPGTGDFYCHRNCSEENQQRGGSESNPYGELRFRGAVRQFWFLSIGLVSARRVGRCICSGWVGCGGSAGSDWYFGCTLMCSG